MNRHTNLLNTNALSKCRSTKPNVKQPRTREASLLASDRQTNLYTDGQRRLLELHEFKKHSILGTVTAVDQADVCSINEMVKQKAKDFPEEPDFFGNGGP